MKQQEKARLEDASRKETNVMGREGLKKEEGKGGISKKISRVKAGFKKEGKKISRVKHVGEHALEHAGQQVQDLLSIDSLSLSVLPEKLEEILPLQRSKDILSSFYALPDKLTEILPTSLDLSSSLGLED